MCEWVRERKRGMDLIISVFDIHRPGHAYKNEGPAWLLKGNKWMSQYQSFILMHSTIHTTIWLVGVNAGECDWLTNEEEESKGQICI